MEEVNPYNLVAENIAKLRAIFPEIVTEGPDGAAINVDVLKQLVGDRTVTDVDERYGLNWHGKRQARELALAPPTGTLRPCPEESVDWETTQNLMIEGDNLEVLKLLREGYAGKVKLIYIDPPYNTGGNLVYADNFRDGLSDYLELTGQAKGEFEGEDTAEVGGRYHTDWLSMMYPRLKVARDLLCDDGVLCMSIDDCELKHASILMDEVFGGETFIGCIARCTGSAAGQNGRGFVKAFDYVLVYGRTPNVKLHGVLPDEEYMKRFMHEDKRGRYALADMRQTGHANRREDGPSRYYPVRDPDGREVFPIAPSGYEGIWRFTTNTYEKFVANDMIVWKRVNNDGEAAWWPYVKYYLEGRTKRPSSLWDDVGSNLGATLVVTELMGDRVFSYPKPLALIEKLVQVVFGAQKDGIVLDFFAGSGTTGHAVMAQNAVDRANRHYILVQRPEPLDPENGSQRLAVEFCDKLGKPRNIAELTKERLRRAAKKIGEELGAGGRESDEKGGQLSLWSDAAGDVAAASDLALPAFDLGFRVFKLEGAS